MATENLSHERGDEGHEQEGRGVMAWCSACGAAAYDADRYCALCGEAIEHRCGHCGATIVHPVAYYCPQCGSSLRPPAHPSD